MEQVGIGLKSTGNYLQDVKAAVDMANYLTYMKQTETPPYQLDSYGITQGNSPDEVLFILNIVPSSKDSAQA